MPALLAELGRLRRPLTLLAGPAMAVLAADAPPAHTVGAGAILQVIVEITGLRQFRAGERVQPRRRRSRPRDYICDRAFRLTAPAFPR